MVVYQVVSADTPENISRCRGPLRCVIGIAYGYLPTEQEKYSRQSKYTTDYRRTTA